MSAARTPFQPAAGCCQSVACRLLAAYGNVRQCGRVRRRGGLMGVVVAAADGAMEEGDEQSWAVTPNLAVAPVASADGLQTTLRTNDEV